MPDPTDRLDRALAELLQLRVELGLLDAEPEGIEPDPLEAALAADPAARQGIEQAAAAIENMYNTGTWTNDAALLDGGLRVAIGRALTIGMHLGIIAASAPD